MDPLLPLHGAIGLSVSENQLFVAIAAIPEAVLAGEKIMDEKRHGTRKSRKTKQCA